MTNGGILHLPRNWRTIVTALLENRHDLEKRRAIIAKQDLTDEQKASIAYMYRNENDPRRRKIAGKPVTVRRN